MKLRNSKRIFPGLMAGAMVLNLLQPQLIVQANMMQVDEEVLVDEQVRLIDIFECEKLAEVVADELGIGVYVDEEISANRLQDVRILFSWNEDRTGIQSLEGIEYLTGLRSLHLTGGGINDLSPLIELEELMHLSLTLNEINYLDSLSEMVQLQTLTLTNIRISDLSPLAGLTGLTMLELENNEISSIAPLENLRQLRWLALSENRIDDLSSLSEMTQLEWLSLSGNQISNLSPLRGLTQLEDLALRNNGIRDITPLTGLIRLENLDLQRNEISDLSALSGMTQLRWLNLTNNRISDLSPLSNTENLGQLMTLHLSQNEISDLSPLADMTGLENLLFLYLTDNRISDLSPLADVTGLERLIRLSLSQNEISDLTPLADMTGLNQLRTLILSNNQISDLRPLANVIESNSVISVSAFGQVINLEPTTLGTETSIDLFLPDGTVPADLDAFGEFTLTNGILAWKTLGNRSLSWDFETPDFWSQDDDVSGLSFSGMIRQTVVADESNDTDGNDLVIPETDYTLEELVEQLDDLVTDFANRIENGDLVGASFTADSWARFTEALDNAREVLVRHNGDEIVSRGVVLDALVSVIAGNRIVASASTTDEADRALVEEVMVELQAAYDGLVLVVANGTDNVLENGMQDATDNSVGNESGRIPGERPGTSGDTTKEGEQLPQTGVVASAGNFFGGMMLSGGAIVKVLKEMNE